MYICCSPLKRGEGEQLTYSRFSFVSALSHETAWWTRSGHLRSQFDYTYKATAVSLNLGCLKRVFTVSMLEGWNNETVLQENRSYFPEMRKCIVFALQHGGNDVTWKCSIHLLFLSSANVPQPIYHAALLLWDNTSMIAQWCPPLCHYDHKNIVSKNWNSKTSF